MLKEEPKSQKVPPFQMSYEASGLDKKKKYEFWVTASTNIGEGQPSKSVNLSPGNRGAYWGDTIDGRGLRSADNTTVVCLGDSVPAKIASFDDSFTATYREDVKLPCLAVGIPAPGIVWKVKGNTLTANDRLRQLPEGSLLIKEVTRGDAGEYSCYVENSFGHDTVTHHLVILGTTTPRFRLLSSGGNDFDWVNERGTLIFQHLHTRHKSLSRQPQPTPSPWNFHPTPRTLLLYTGTQFTTNRNSGSGKLFRLLVRHRNIL